MSSLGQGTYNGLTFGEGTALAITALDGLDDLPGVRASDLAYDGRHGEASGPDYAGPRIIVLGLGLRGVDPADLELLRALVRDTFTASEDVHELTLRNGTVVLYAKPRRRALPRDMEHDWRLGDGLIELYCPDPRVFGPSETVATGLATASGGFGFPLAFPLSFGGTGQTDGTLTLGNDGTAPGRVVFTIDAGAEALQQPLIEHVGFGVLRITGTIAAGTSAVLDADARTLVVNGVSRRDLVADDSVWPTLPAGGATYRFGAGAYSSTALLSVTARSANI